MLLAFLLSVRASNGMRVSRSSGSQPQMPTPIPPCDLSRLQPSMFENARHVTRSLGGSMGGVYFLTIPTGADDGWCSLVAKPRVDIRDVFAGVLAEELDAPVIKSIVVKQSDPLFKATLQGIESGHVANNSSETAKQMAADFMKAFDANWKKPGRRETDGYIQLMAKSVGKDPYNYLKGFQYETCEECKEYAVEEKLKSMSFEQEIEEKIQQYTSKLIRGESPGPFDRPMLVKALGENFEEEPEDEGQRQAKRDENAKKLRAWMLENTNDKVNQLRSLLRQQKLAKEKAVSTYDCDGLNGAEKQQPEIVEERLMFVRESIRGQKKELGALAAFLSIVGEYDSIPAPSWETPISNMQNVMVSPSKIEGIDIRVGGANPHIPLERDGSSPTIGSVKSFLLVQAARQGLCKETSGIDPEELEGMELALRIRINTPFFNGAFHDHGKQCYLEKGSLFEEDENENIARTITEETFHAFREHMGKIKAAVAMTVARLAGVGNPNELMDIVGWLMHRVDLFQEQMDEVDALCPPALDLHHAGPLVNETHGSSLDGKAPPMPPSFKHSDKMGYVWHTVETMWKKAHGQWFGTRTTDIVAVPLKPA